MKEVIGVRFRENGKIYFFNPLNYKIDPGRFVIVETQHGVEFGKVVLGRREVDETKLQGELKPIIRIATEADEKKHAENLEKNKNAMEICKEKIANRGLEMKLIGAEYSFDNSKVLFYFTADGRVDFRELVKDLAAVFKTRIELRQVGVRDETKILGGIGICGRQLCCNAHLSEFGPVSIKMAKEQSLSLNPTKISGVCGRLMCCLSYEEQTYEYLNDRMPNIGDYVKTPTGQKGEVTGTNVLRQMVKVVVTNDAGEKEVLDFKVDELRFKPKRRRDKSRVSAEEMKELEELEKQEKKEGKSKLDD